MSNLKYIFLILIVGCSPKTEKEKLYSICSKAKCKGPSREYHTELHATTDGYTKFHQSYSDSNQDYVAVSYNDTLGFTVASDTIERWTQIAEISVGKGHSFHMIAYDPMMVFNYVNEKFYDAVNNEVKFEFVPESNRVQSFQIINPFDATESIEIFFSKWEDVQGFDLPMRVHIIQGEKDEFFFEFYEVKIDDPSFLKFPIP